VVRTWVSDFRRATSRRLYKLRVQATDEPAAEAYSDWIFLDSATMRPARVPEEMIAAFAPDGRLGQVERRPFPEFAPPPPGVFEMRRRARWSEIDGAGHVNNAAYLSFLEDSAMELMQSGGWPASRLHEAGLGIVAREYLLDYRGPALLSDELRVATWISELRRSSAVRRYTIQRAADGELLLRAQAVWVWVDLRTGRPSRIPDDFLAAFAGNVASD
jgi:acyl-CoA thioester hydrolase